MEELTERLMGVPNKNAGYIVETKTGKLGRTYHKDDLKYGKLLVYTDEGNLLCDPKSVTIKGFID